MNNTKSYNPIVKLLLGIFGTFTSACGAVFFITANNGMDPLSVYCQGLSNTLGLQLGTWSLISGVTVLIIVHLLDRKMFKWGSFINAFGVGFFINVIMAVYVPTFDSTLQAGLGTLLGAFLLAFGIAIVIFSELGMGPWEGLMTYLSRKTKISIKFIRIAMDVTLTLIGFSMGGVIGWGSIIGFFGIGPIIEYSLKLLNFVFVRKSKVSEIA